MKRNVIFMVSFILSILLSNAAFAGPGEMWRGAEFGWTNYEGHPFSDHLLHTSVVFDNKMWVIGGAAGAVKNDVWYSSNGVTWTQATGAAAFSARHSHTSVVFDNKMWVIGGYYTGSVRLNDVWYSSNGVTWTQATGAAAFSPRYGHTSVVFDNKMWVIGGGGAPGVNTDYRNDVWYSSDGVMWTQATGAAAFSARIYHTSVVFDNKMWVIGGNDDARKNDVWYSSNGVTWTQATGAAAFSARIYHTSVVFDNKIWVIGGYDGAGKNDVWYSSDGVTWTQATSAAAFSARYWHTSVVFDNKMWVIGGNDSVGYKNDVWYSSDGVTWTQATGAAAFSGRYNHTSVVFDNKMWVIGGVAGKSKNDVWLSGMGSKADISPLSLSFGEQPVAAGAKGPLTATLANLYPQGWEPLNISFVQIQNDAEGAFSFSTVPTTGALLVNDERQFGILFDPSFPGVKTADLVITSDDPTSPVITISLSGNGAATNLTIVSAYGSPIPAVGTHLITSSPVSASVTSPVSGGAGTQYVCTGWTRVGSLPGSDIGTTTTFSMDQETTLTWNWKTQYQLTISTDPSLLPAGCDVTPASGGWYNSGTIVPLQASSLFGSPHFINWTGDITSANPNESITMNTVRTIIAHFGPPNTEVRDWKLIK